MKHLTSVAVFVAVVLLTVGCGGGDRQAVNDYLDAALPLLEEWHISYSSVTSDSRTALAPVIDKIQDIRQRYSALEPPEPCEDLHQYVMSAMDHSIRGFTAYRDDAPKEDVERELTLTQQQLDMAREALAELSVEYSD